MSNPEEEGGFVNKGCSTSLNLCGKYLFFAIAGITLAGPNAIAQVKAAPHPAPASGGKALAAKRMAFEVVSIRPSARGFFGGASPERETPDIQPDGYRAVDQPLISTIIFAYLPMSYSLTPDSKPLNQPSWSGDEYDIQAKVAPADMAEWQKQGPQKEMLSAMLRTMLEDRCKLAVHWITSQTTGYTLIVAKHGPKLKKAIPGEPVPPNGRPVRISNVMVPGATYFPISKGDPRTDLRFYNISMEALAAWLSMYAETPILDQTGLAGNYDVVLLKRAKEDVSDFDPGPSIGYDVDGLKLVSSKVPTKRLVIDHIERPSTN